MAETILSRVSCVDGVKAESQLPIRYLEHHTAKTWNLTMSLASQDIQIIITPLNLLGQQNVNSLDKASIAVHLETATPTNFRAIENLSYRVTTISPEQAMKPGVTIIFDKAHCITEWDRPHISISVCKIEHSLTSYVDLAFVVSDGWKMGDPPPEKFLIFFDNIQDSINAAKYLHNQLPPELQHKIVWFNSDMSTSFKEAQYKHL
ncbi:hypothetical protein SERLA73DRAFT_151081 [Serpula lacrymans var. lacrymans S7.3]|uniref:Uncharacterized protein n=1 Tax=Serpula lacrymans var. lacrymans (strain S7.3) TaxID=936435 RepID=F8PPM7_SERL3|nr:hypothetical protein SERLA73DRAFT_151081 [Serpula lacrymans var. lacrymans S7.3]